LESVQVGVSCGANLTIGAEIRRSFSFGDATLATKLARHWANDLIARCWRHRITAIARKGGHAPLREEHGGKEECVPNSVHCITRTP